MSTLGKIIRRTRKKQGLTLQQLSDLTGLSTAFLSNLERGLRAGHSGSRKIFKALDMPEELFQLIEEIDGQEEEEALAESARDKTAEEVGDLTMKLFKYTRNSIERVLCAIEMRNL